MIGIAQNKVSQELCGSQLINAKLMKEDPSFSEKIQSFDKQLSRMVKSGKMSQSYNESGKVYEIPVVVHIIHTGGAIGTQYNKSDAEIQAWVDFTNRVYEGTAPALAGPGQRANIPIRFVLAIVSLPMVSSG